MKTVKLNDLLEMDISKPMVGGKRHDLVVVGKVTKVNEFRAEYVVVEILKDEGNPGVAVIGMTGGFALQA